MIFRVGSMYVVHHKTIMIKVTNIIKYGGVGFVVCLVGA
jgi:hypothetical protein